MANGALGLHQFEIVAEPEPDRPLSRVVAYEDWDDRSWSCFLEPMLFDRVARREVQRDWNTWERTHLLFGLHRCGKLERSTRVLVCAVMPDQVVGTLSELVGQTEVFDLTHQCKQQGPAARLFWSNGGYYARDALVPHGSDMNFGDLPERAYDAVIFPHGSLFWNGVPGIVRLLREAERLLKEGGVVAFKAEILAGDRPSVDRFDYALAVEFAERLEVATGLTVEGGFDARLSQQTASRIIPEPPTTPPADSVRPAATSLWFARKAPSPGAGDWFGLRDYLIDRLLGEQLDRLSIGPAGSREGPSRIVTESDRSGHVFFGPYLALSRGRYEAVIGVKTLTASRQGRLRFEVVVDGEVAAATEMLGSAGASSPQLHLPFDIQTRCDGELLKAEIRGWSSNADAEISACQLVRAGP